MHELGQLDMKTFFSFADKYFARWFYEANQIDDQMSQVSIDGACLVLELGSHGRCRTRIRTGRSPDEDI